MTDQNISASLLRDSLRNSGLSELLLPLGVDTSSLVQLERSLPTLPRMLKRHEVLFEQASPPSSLYLVKRGLVKSDIVTYSGIQHVTAFHLPGEVVGLDAFAGSRHPCRAVAVTQCELLRVGMMQVGELSQKVPALARALWQLMRHEIAESEQMLLVLGSTPATQRVATFLLSWFHRHNGRSSTRSKMQLKASKADIASYLGLRHETLRRRLADFERLGIIHMPTRNSVEILDLVGLARMAGVYGGAST